MKAINLLVNSVLPEELRDPARTFDKKSLETLLAEVARTHPDKYSAVVQAISNAGRRAAYWQGETLTLSDMLPVVDKDEILGRMDEELDQIEMTDLPDDDKRKQKMAVWSRYSTEMEAATKEQALAKGNNLGNAVLSGARGNPLQLKSMLTSPALFTDYRDQMIPLFVRRGFNEGLRPYEYLASTFGVRKGVISTKASTAESGDLAKQLVQAAASVVVTDDDCGTNNGLDFEVNDPDLEGRVTAKTYGKIPAGSPIDKHVMDALRRQKVDVVIARSPMTCQAKNGICAHCLGLLPEGTFAPLGYSAGVTAAQAVSEPLTQGALNCLVEGTLVRMADGTVRSIEHIRPGEYVLGANLMGETSPVMVSAKWDQGLQPCYRYTYKLGSTQQTVLLEATEEHPVLSNKKVYGKHKSPNNAKLVKLKAGYPHHNLGAVFPTTSHWTGPDCPLSLLLGVYLGDGIRNTGKGELRFSCADTTMIDHLRRHSETLGLDFTKRKRSHDWCIASRNDVMLRDPKSGRAMSGLRNPLKQLLERFGLLGKYAHEKFLPKEVWTWATESIAELIAGFVAADGSVYTNADGHVGISFSSTSRQLLSDLKEIMAVRLCVYTSSITQIGEADTDGRNHDLWQFYITRLDQVLRLAGLMPKIPGVKGPLLDQLVSTRGYSLRHSEGFYRAKRVHIESIGLRHCWDLTVENSDHLFVLANNLIVSNTKHGGGGFKGDKKMFAGFDVIDQIVQSPETYPFKAAVSTLDGQVEKIEDAPQGGKFIYVGGEQHYVLPGFEPAVKVGDTVEEGDTLSEGITDVYDVLKHRGLGEARRYYVDRLRQAFKESDAGSPSKINLETLARATLNHVIVEDPDGLNGFLPDDVASYNSLSTSYSPPKDTKQVSPDQAVGQYLQTPMLHFTINTRLTPKMVQRIRSAGINSIPVSSAQPKFRPEMFRLRAAAHPGTDWLAKMHTSYLTVNLGQDAARARETNVERNVHFAPRLAIGEGFGKNVEETGEF